MKTEMKTAIRQKGNSFYLRFSYQGKQREVALGSSRSNAKTRAKRFTDTLVESGFEKAVDQLKGKSILKPSKHPTFEMIKTLYLEYCQCASTSPRPITIKRNLSCLKLLMSRTHSETISTLTSLKIKSTLPKNPTAAQKTTYATNVRSAKSIFGKWPMKFYMDEGWDFSNPFEDVRVDPPKVENYTPLPAKVRDRIENDCEDELEPACAMIVLIALLMGLRRSEIEACRCSWFSVQDDAVHVSVKEEIDFKPKSGEKRDFRITLDIYERLIHLRKMALISLSHVEGTRNQEDEAGYFVPVLRRKKSGDRLWRKFRTVSEWLHSKGNLESRPLHQMRKEAGCAIVKSDGLYAASKVLGHANTQITEKHYTNITAGIVGRKMEQETPLEAMAKMMGLSVDEVQKRLFGTA